MSFSNQWQEHSSHGSRGYDPTPPDCLTRREVAIVRAYRDGQSTKAIARVPNLSPKTVENLIARIYRKLRVRHRTDLIRMDVCEGWLRRILALPSRRTQP